MIATTRRMISGSIVGPGMMLLILKAPINAAAGEPVSVYADLRRINPVIAGEDAGYSLFEHRGGVRALFDGNRHLDHNADTLRRTMGEALIEDTQGTIELRGDGAVRLRPCASAALTELLPPDTWDGFGGDGVHALQTHVVAGILDGTP